MFGEHADANATTHAEGMTLDDESRAHLFHNPFRYNRYIGYLLHAVQHDQEFVAAHPGYCVVFPRAVLEPFRNLLQHHISERVSERVIDDFEPVEIEKQQRNFLISPASDSQSIV